MAIHMSQRCVLCSLGFASLALHRLRGFPKPVIGETLQRLVLDRAPFTGAWCEHQDCHPRRVQVRRWFREVRLPRSLVRAPIWSTGPRRTISVIVPKTRKPEQGQAPNRRTGARSSYLRNISFQCAAPNRKKRSTVIRFTVCQFPVSSTKPENRSTVIRLAKFQYTRPPGPGHPITPASPFNALPCVAISAQTLRRSCSPCMPTSRCIWTQWCWS